MSEERIREKFVWKLFEKTVNNEIENIDNDEIEKELLYDDKVAELLELALLGERQERSHKLFTA